MNVRKPDVYEPTQKEKDEINASLDLLDELFAKLRLPDDMPNLKAADCVVRWWHKASTLERPPRDVMIKALGGTLGCVIREYSAFQWKRVEYADGPSLALVAADARAGPVVLSPIDMVAKRFDQKRDGCLEECFAGLVGVDQVRHFFKREALAQWGFTDPGNR